VVIPSFSAAQCPPVPPLLPVCPEILRPLATTRCTLFPGPFEFPSFSPRGMDATLRLCCFLARDCPLRGYSQVTIIPTFSGVGPRLNLAYPPYLTRRRDCSRTSSPSQFPRTSCPTREPCRPKRLDRPNFELLPFLNRFFSA